MLTIDEDNIEGRPRKLEMLSLRTKRFRREHRALRLFIRGSFSSSDKYEDRRMKHNVIGKELCDVVHDRMNIPNSIPGVLLE